MSHKRLFKADEIYTKLGSQLDDEVSEYAALILEKYKDCTTRDVVAIVNNAFDVQACYTRLCRRMPKATKKG